MDSNSNLKLTSTEIGALWTTYMNDSLVTDVLRYFLEKVKDSEIKPNIEYALSITQGHIQRISDIFNKEGYPIPQGFTEEDVNINAPTLYTDNFYLFYLRNIARLNLDAYGIALTLMSRQDTIDFFTDGIFTATELTRRVINTIITKGLLIAPPNIIIPDKIDFIKKNSFLTGFLGEHRRLTALEISLLYANIQLNVIGSAMLTGFSQVAESSKISEFMTQGVYIAKKHIEAFSNKLEVEDIPAITTSETYVTDSKQAPFSDKLMQAHVNNLISIGFDNYSTALVTSMRHDLQADYLRLMTEIAKFGMESISIMIEKGWLEQPPQAIKFEPQRV